MQDWIKENSVPITIVLSTVVALATVLTVILTSTNSIHHRLDDMNQRLNDMRAEMNQRFDAQDKYINQRFDAMDQRLERLENDVTELRQLTVSISERVSRNEGQIDVLRQRLQTADTPSP